MDSLRPDLNHRAERIIILPLTQIKYRAFYNFMESTV